MDKAIKHQIEMAAQLTGLIQEDFDVDINTSDLLDLLAVSGLMLQPSLVSPVDETITLSNDAYFASLGQR